MKLPADVEYLEDHHLFVWRPRGVLDEALINKITTFIADQEATRDRPFNRFIDTSAIEAVDINFKYIFHVALYRRLALAGHSPVKSAFLVTTPEVARIVKVHALVADHSPLQVAMFEDCQAAADWLGVPLGLLVKHS